MSNHLGCPVGGSLHTNAKALAYHLGEPLPQGRMFSAGNAGMVSFPIKLRSPRTLWALSFVGREPQTRTLRGAGYEAL